MAVAIGSDIWEDGSMTTEADERGTRRARSVEEIDTTFDRMLTDDGLMSGLCSSCEATTS